MSEPAPVSRRALFTLGIARVAGDPASRLESEPARPAVATVDREDWVARQNVARGRCDERGMCDPAVTALLAAVAPSPGRVLAVGDGREHCMAAGTAVQWTQADPAALPFADGSFGAAVSAFAPMFCTDARASFAELFRVVAPGGIVAFTAWTPGGIAGRLLRLAAQHDPPPRGLPAPTTWGREERLRQDLEVHSDDVRFERRTIELSFDGLDEAVDCLCRALHPLLAVPGQAPLRAAVRECVAALADGGDSPLTLSAPYVLARAVRRSPGAPVLY